MPYAVNLADLTYPDRCLFAQMLLAPVTSGRTVGTGEKDRGTGVRFDAVALVLDCPDERAAAIIEVIRTRLLRVRDRRPWRCYYSKTGNGGWRQIRMPYRRDAIADEPEGR